MVKSLQLKRQLGGELLEARTPMAADVMGAVAASQPATESGATDNFATALFARLDANEDGNLASSELGEKLAGKLAVVDTDGDSLITSTEFETFRASQLGSRHAGGGKARLTPEARATQVISRFDTDQNGSLETSEIGEKFATRLNGADTDANGSVSATELTAFMGAKQQLNTRPTAAHGGKARLTPEARATQVISKFDTDQNGSLETSEIGEKLATRLNGADTDANGSVSATELTAFMGAKQQLNTRPTAAQVVDKIFSTWDRNQDGSLNQANDNLSEKQWSRAVQSDADGNGSVTQAELTGYLESRPTSGQSFVMRSQGHARRR